MPFCSSSSSSRLRQFTVYLCWLHLEHWHIFHDCIMNIIADTMDDIMKRPLAKASISMNWNWNGQQIKASMTKTLTSNQWTPTANASMNKNIIFKLSLFNQFQFSTLYRFHSNTHYTHKHARSYFPFVFLMIDFLIGFSCNTIPTHCVYSVISRCILCIENDCQNE